MKHTIKRLLGLALILVLMCSLLPAWGAAALAEDEPETPVGEEPAEPTEPVDEPGEPEEPAPEPDEPAPEPDEPKEDEVTAYGVWIGDTEITSENLSGTGWSYAPASNTLTLDNPTIDSYHEVGVIACRIYASGDLRIEGSASLSASGGNRGCIQCEGNLDLKVGTLTLVADGYWPLYVKGAISMEGGTLKATAQDGAYDAIYGKNGVSISGGTVTASSKGQYGIRGGNVSISGGTVEARGLAGIYTNGSVSITGGSVTAVGTRYAGIKVFGTFSIGGGVSRLEAQGIVDPQYDALGAMQASSGIQIDSGLAFLEPADGGVGTAEGLNNTYSCVKTKNGEGEIATHVVLEPAPYTVDATANPPEGGTVSGAGTYKSGETATLTAAPKEHYHFVNWTENKEEVSTNAEYSFTVNSDRTLTANFELDTHTVDVNVSPTGGGTVSGGGTYDYGTIVTLKAAAKDGYAFVNWTENGKEVGAKEEYTLTVEGDRTLTANFVKLYTVKFESNGGSAVKEQTVKEGDKATKPKDPTRTDYIFQGWYSDKDLTKAYDFGTAVKADLTLYAKWKEDIKYTVAKGNNSVVNKGGTADLELTVKRNFHDEVCFTHFLKVQLDGKDLVKDTDYTAKSGSTVVTIKHETLSKLSTGNHTITVVFDDGYATAYITVKAGSGGNNTTPKTGDRSTTGLWIALIAAALALGGVAYLLVRNRRKALAEAAAAEEVAEEVAEEIPAEEIPAEPAPEEKKE